MWRFLRSVAFGAGNIGTQISISQLQKQFLFSTKLCNKITFFAVNAEKITLNCICIRSQNTLIWYRCAWTITQKHKAWCRNNEWLKSDNQFSFGIPNFSPFFGWTMTAEAIVHETNLQLNNWCDELKMIGFACVLLKKWCELWFHYHSPDYSGPNDLIPLNRNCWNSSFINAESLFSQYNTIQWKRTNNLITFAQVLKFWYYWRLTIMYSNW